MISATRIATLGVRLSQCFCTHAHVRFRPWKFEHMATDLLSLQLRDDHPLPTDAVLYFTQGLIHDSISIRKVRGRRCTSELVFVPT